MRMRKLGLAAASVAIGAAAVIAVPASALAAPAAGTSQSISTAAEGTASAPTWQWTGEYYSTKSRCMADADYYLEASNVYDYRCVRSSGLWGGQVYAD